MDFSPNIAIKKELGHIYKYIYMCIYMHIHIQIHISYMGPGPAARPSARPDPAARAGAHVRYMYLYVYMHMCMYLYMSPSSFLIAMFGEKSILGACSRKSEHCNLGVKVNISTFAACPLHIFPLFPVLVSHFWELGDFFMLNYATAVLCLFCYI